MNVKSPAQPRQAALRWILAALVLGSAATAALTPGRAQEFGGHDSEAPVSVSADHGELQGRQDRATLSGNVVITQGELILRAARTTLVFSSASGNFKIHRLDATGGVTVTRGGQSASGQVAVYDFDRRIITLAGGVVLQRGQDRLNAARLVIDLNTGISRVDGGAAGEGARGRVSGTFSVPRKSN